MNINKLSAKQILVYNRLQGRRENSKLLIRALIEIGFPEYCSKCSVVQWNNGKVKLLVYHQDNNSLNNCSYNLRLLCPNCYVQFPKSKIFKNLSPVEEIQRIEDRKFTRDLNKAIKSMKKEKV